METLLKPPLFLPKPRWCWHWSATSAIRPSKKSYSPVFSGEKRRWLDSTTKRKKKTAWFTDNRGKMWDIYSESCFSVLSEWCTWGSGHNQISIVAALTGHKICRSPTKGNSSFTPNLYPSCAHLPPLEPRNKLQDTLACCVSASSARVESAALQGCLLRGVHKSQAKPVKWTFAFGHTSCGASYSALHACTNVHNTPPTTPWQT